MSHPTLFLGNDHLVVETLTTTSPTTGLVTPFTGQVVQVLYGATSDATDPIAPGLLLTMVERGTTGVYAVTVTGAVLSSLLATYKGKHVYEIVRCGTVFRSYLTVLVAGARGDRHETTG